MLARHRANGKMTAVKLINEVFYNSYEAKKVCREITLMRHLSKQKLNIYSVKLFDVIVPPSDENLSLPSKSSLLFDSLFLVEEYFGKDIKQLIQERRKLSLNEEHIKIITFNMLNAANYLHK